MYFILLLQFENVVQAVFKITWEVWWQWVHPGFVPTRNEEGVEVGTWGLPSAKALIENRDKKNMS